MLRIVALILFVLLSASSARAAFCAVSIEDLDFGEIDSLAASPSDTVATIRIDCQQVSAGASVISACIQLGAGTGGSGGGMRHLASGSNEIDFQLYRDSGRSVAWGGVADPGLGDPVEVSFAASGQTATTTLTLYGRVGGSQSSAAAGSYSSSLTGADAVYSYVEAASLDCQATGGATTGQSSFNVSARVLANCLVEASDIAFGQHDIIDQNIDASGNIGITCTPGTQYSVTLGGGLRAASNPEARLLQSGADQATYGLYRDSARTQPWGSSLQTQLPGTGAGARQSVVVYGRVPPQTVPPGTYTDTVAVTITYDNVP